MIAVGSSWLLDYRLSGRGSEPLQRFAETFDGRALLTARELAKFFDVSPRTVRRWVETDDFPKPVQPGQRLLWRAVDVADFVNDYTTSGINR